MTEPLLLAVLLLVPGVVAYRAGHEQFNGYILTSIVVLMIMALMLVAGALTGRW